MHTRCGIVIETPRDLLISGHESFSSLTNERDKVATLTPKDCVRLHEKSASMVQDKRQRRHESSDSATSATEMLSNPAKGVSSLHA